VNNCGGDAARVVLRLGLAPECRSWHGSSRHGYRWR
jgi:hypothetical protein